MPECLPLSKYFLTVNLPLGNINTSTTQTQSIRRLKVNTDDLTIGQVRELASMVNGSQRQSNLMASFIGKYVICRSRNEGVNAGKVIAADDTGVVLEDARRLYYHKPANKNVSWYEGVAKFGLSDDSKTGEPVQKVIVEGYSLTVCTVVAEKSIREADKNVQS